MDAELGQEQEGAGQVTGRSSQDTIVAGLAALDTTPPAIVPAVPLTQIAVEPGTLVGAPVGVAVAPVAEVPVRTPDQAAADSLRAVLGRQPGITPAVAALIRGETVGEVEASFAMVQAALSEAATLRIPAARAGSGGALPAQSPLDHITAGLAARQPR